MAIELAEYLKQKIHSLDSDHPDLPYLREELERTMTHLKARESEVKYDPYSVRQELKALQRLGILSPSLLLNRPVEVEGVSVTEVKDENDPNRFARHIVTPVAEGHLWQREDGNLELNFAVGRGDKSLDGNVLIAGITNLESRAPKPYQIIPVPLHWTDVFNANVGDIDLGYKDVDNIRLHLPLQLTPLNLLRGTVMLDAIKTSIPMYYAQHTLRGWRNLATAEQSMLPLETSDLIRRELVELGVSF